MKYILEHQLIGFWSCKINKYNSEYVYKETVSERLWLTQRSYGYGELRSYFYYNLILIYLKLILIITEGNGIL